MNLNDKTLVALILVTTPQDQMIELVEEKDFCRLLSKTSRFIDTMVSALEVCIRAAPGENIRKRACAAIESHVNNNHNGDLFALIKHYYHNPLQYINTLEAAGLNTDHLTRRDW